MTTLQKAILISFLIILISILTGFVVFIRNDQTASVSIVPFPTIPAFNATSEFNEMDMKLTPEPETIIARFPSTESAYAFQTEEPTSSETAGFFPTVTARSQPCPMTSSGGLVTEMRAIIAAMPLAGSNGFVEPSVDQITVWESLIHAILKNDLLGACAIIKANGFPYQLVQFTDIFSDGRQYIVLHEITPVKAGWGTYVFFQDKNASPFVVEVPHPLADWNTEIEGVEIFRKVNARALLVAGAHRCANNLFSPCTGTTIACGQVEPYRISDVNHTVQNVFHTTHQIVAGCQGDLIALQLHGNSVSNCPDIFVSNGTTHPGGLAGNLTDRISSSCKEYNVDLADGEEGECAFTGGGSPQAVFSNTCGYSNPIDACTNYALRPSIPEQFISLEQSLRARQNFDCIITALQNKISP